MAGGHEEIFVSQRENSFSKFRQKRERRSMGAMGHLGSNIWDPSWLCLSAPRNDLCCNVSVEIILGKCRQLW